MERSHQIILILDLTPSKFDGLLTIHFVETQLNVV